MKDYFTIESLAEELEISELTIRRYVLEKKIPYYKVARKVRFIRSEILEWVKNNAELAFSAKKKTEDGK